ncbi:MAG TPA: PAC2 family protein [Dehalococcoidia bacterium]|nr:PAC2 family protein [Dehalococcoidia bacterium]
MEIEQLPELDRPNVIAAFSGWNDAGQAATTAVRYLIEAWHAQHFAHIDPEEYYSFTDTRPTIRILEGTQRQLTWPANEFYFSAGSDTQPAAVLMVGVEPNLKWRSYCGEVVRLAKSVGARRLVTMGSLITDTVHTRAVPLTGFSTDDGVQARFSSRGITRSSYEGPTGVVGALHDACNRAELPAASIWAASPFYLGSTPNPKTALGLLDALDEALGLRLDLSELRKVADEFVRQVSLAVRDNDEVQERIRTLEERADAAQPSEGPPEFPPTGAIIADLEQFLRKQRDDPPGA